jgi:hypothetical protein
LRPLAHEILHKASFEYRLGSSSSRPFGYDHSAVINEASVQ